MEIEPIKRYETCTDCVYDAFLNEYCKYIPEEVDTLFVNMLNHIKEYNLHQGSYLSLIKEDLKIISIDMLDFDIDTEYIDFKSIGEVNLRLLLLLPKIIKIRKLAYEKAYYLANELVLDNTPDYKLQEDFLLVTNILKEIPFENFYADLVIYNTESTINRYYFECDLLDLICDALNHKTITMERINSLEHNLYKLHTNIFNYLKKRYVSNNKILEKR